MKNLVLIIFLFPFLTACNSDMERRLQEKKRQRQVLRQKPNESLQSLQNTAWTSEVLSDCHDTLKFIGQNTGALYSCEKGYLDKMMYYISADTVIIDLQSGKADEPVPSRWKMVMKDGKLLFTYIAHKYEDEFQEVKPVVYTTITTFEKVK